MFLFISWYGKYMMLSLETNMFEPKKRRFGSDDFPLQRAEL